MMKYNISKDYDELKRLLDEGNTVVILWTHDTTRRLFAGLAQKVIHRDNDVFYDIDSWMWWPQRSDKPFNKKCAEIGLDGVSFIIPNES